MTNHALCGVCDCGLEAPARQRALVGSIVANENLRAFAPVGTAADAHDGRKRRAAAGGAGLSNRVEDALDLTTTHVTTFPYCRAGGNPRNA